MRQHSGFPAGHPYGRVHALRPGQCPCRLCRCRTPHHRPASRPLSSLHHGPKGPSHTEHHREAGGVRGQTLAGWSTTLTGAPKAAETSAFRDRIELEKPVRRGRTIYAAIYSCIGGALSFLRSERFQGLRADGAPRLWCRRTRKCRKTSIGGKLTPAARQASIDLGNLRGNEMRALVRIDWTSCRFCGAGIGWLHGVGCRS